MPIAIPTPFFGRFLDDALNFNLGNAGILSKELMHSCFATFNPVLCQRNPGKGANLFTVNSGYILAKIRDVLVNI